MTAARRPARLLLAAATALGLWFGVSAPDVSPVSPEGVAVVQDAGGPAADGEGRRGGRR